MQGAATVSHANLARQREVVDAFLVALRAGDFEGLLAVLDPDGVVRVDAAGVAPGGSREVRGARTWAKGALAFSRGARFAQPALVNGAVGVVLVQRGRLFGVLTFTITRGKIVQIDVVADPARLGQLDPQRSLTTAFITFLPLDDIRPPSASWRIALRPFDPSPDPIEQEWPALR